MCLLGSWKDQKKKKIALNPNLCRMLFGDDGLDWGCRTACGEFTHLRDTVSSHRVSIEKTLLKHESIFLIADILVANFECYRSRN